MRFAPLSRLRYAEGGDFQLQNDGYVHCKTLPLYIFAQAYEGFYEIEAGSEYAVCEEGGAFFTPPNVPLKIRHRVNAATGVMRVRYIHFLAETETGLDLFSGRKLQLAIPAADCVAPAERLSALLKNDAPDEFCLTAEILLLLSQLYCFTTPAGNAALPLEIEKLCNWIRRNAASAIRAEDLAGRVGMSRSKFFAQFHTATGMTPGEFILRERIRHAAQLLLMHPSLSVKEAAEQCNFLTPYHFSRVFRRVMGEPPGRFRNNAHELFRASMTTQPRNSIE